MSTIKSSPCFICSCSTGFENGSGSVLFGNGVLSQQLEVIFVLCKVLEVPKPKLESYLQEFPAVEQWIRVCDKCGDVVKRCWGIWAELRETQRRFQECQLELIGMIREKGGREEEGTGARAGGRIFIECRQLANKHEYSKLNNPFVEGDLIAQQKALTGFVKTEPAEKEDKDCEWTPERNESPLSEVDISDGSSSGKEDNYKPVTRTKVLKLKPEKEEDEDCDWAPEGNDSLSSDDGDLTSDGSRSETEDDSRSVPKNTKVLNLKPGGQKPCLVPSCSRKFGDWKKLTKHVSSEHTAEERQNGWKLECLQCSFLFTNYKSLQCHTWKVHKFTGNCQKTPLNTRYVRHGIEISGNFNDDRDANQKCSEILSAEGGDVKETTEVKYGLKPCLLRSCSRKFPSWSALDKHFSSEHSKEEKVQNSWKLACLLCSDLFRTYGALRAHTVKVHNGGIGKGRAVIKTRYVGVGAKVEKKKRRMTKQSFVCPFCGRFRCRAANPNKTCRHLERCRKQSNVMADLHCPTCKVFSCAGDNPAEFYNHWTSCGVTTKVCATDRLFHCKICSEDASWTGRVFLKLHSFLEHYFLHQRFHYECTECGEKLKTMDHSHWHWQKKHTNLLLSRGTFVPTQCHRQLEPHAFPEVYWWCSECGAQFFSEDQRDQHLTQEHPDQIKVEKIEQCSFCDKQYTCADELKLHQTTTHVVEMGKLIPCQLCKDPQLFLNNDQVLVHRRRFHKKEVLKCLQCGKEFLETDQLSVHTANCKEKGLEQDNGQRCTICNKLFASEVTLQIHFKNVHSEKELVPCHVCGKGFTQQASLQLHLFKAHQIENPNMKKCSEPGCHEVFVRLKDLREHVIKCHGGQRHYLKCSYCGKEFAKLSSLKRHERFMHQHRDDPSMLYSCGLCPFKSHFKANVKKHRTTVHENPRVYYIPCSVCGTMLRTKKDLREHIRKEHKPEKTVRTRTRKTAKTPKSKPNVDKPLTPCPVPNCSEMFPTVKARMDHLKARHSKQERIEAIRVPCSECGKRFAGVHTLRFHKAEVHSQSAEQSCVCDVCGKSYSRYSQLYQHKRKRWQCQRVQLTEEQVVAICEICGLRSRNKFALYQHVRDQHSNRPKETFRCQEEGCEKMFRSKKNLHWHIMGVHQKGEPQFGCKLCAKRYHSPGGLSQHVNWVHRGYRYVKSKQRKT